MSGTLRQKLLMFLVLAAAGFAAGWTLVHAVSGAASPGGMNNVESASGQTSDGAPKKEGTLKKLLSKDDKNAAPKAPPASVRVAPVTQEDVAPELSAVGNVIPYESVALTARVNSQVADVKFKAGDDVVKGQVLFVLDSRELRAQLDQAKAKLAGDEAQLENLKKDYDRQELGVSQGFSAKAQRDAAKAAYENQQALIASDKASIENLAVQVSYTTLTAPISGRTGTINVTQGNLVRANDTTPLVTINQIKPISVQAALPQNSLDNVRAAMASGPLSVSAVTNTGKTAQGTLEYIDNAIDPSTGTFAARVTFDNADETLWPGTLVNIKLQLGQGQPGLIIPQVAVQHDQQKNGDYVYVVAPDSTAQRRDVKVARIQNDQAVISDGLEAGERVAVDGIMNIKDGGKVSVDTSAEKDENADSTLPAIPDDSGTSPVLPNGSGQ